MLLAGSLALSTFLLNWNTGLADDKKAPADDGITVQARGPLHEAYAQPQKKDPTPTAIIPKQPPAPVPEEPPEQKPKGDTVQWMPGYWAWDTEKKDYLWISGFWRVPPPDQAWKPGYWHEAEGGWQWVPGYWTSAKDQEPTYLPKPPASLENGPSTPAPDDEQFYNPGSWVYRSNGYAWRPGFWARSHRGWVWNAPYYLWTPAGYVHVDGYWDYPLEERGLLFAPVHFDRRLWESPDWYYQPNYVVGADELLDSLFVRPGAYQYCYGDYYGPGYAGLGFYPWFSFGVGFYDPLFCYYRWWNRHNLGWYRGLQNVYWARCNGLLPRPGVTGTGLATRGVVTPLNQFHSQNVQLSRVNSAQLAEQRVNGQNLREDRFQRQRLETSPAGTPGVHTVRAEGAAHTVERQSFASGFSTRSSGGAGPEHVYQRGTNSSVDHASQAGNWRSGPSYQSRMSSSPSYRGGGSYGGSFGGGRSAGGGGHGGGGGGHR
jgi:hypothetical protein